MPNPTPKVHQSYGIADNGTPYYAETPAELDRLARIYGGNIVEVKA